MKRHECEFEPEVLSAVLEARWPGRADAGLVAHVADCAICADIVTIAGAIEDSRGEIMAPRILPDSGLVWWMAQRRARLEAAQAASRPIEVTQAIALVCAAAALCAYFAAVAWRFQTAFARMASGAGDFHLVGRLAAAGKMVAEHGGLAVAMAAVLLLVPAAALLAIGRE